jgi:hypothetical protein
MARVEFRPWNAEGGRYVVVVPVNHGEMWFAFASRERAESKQPMIEREYFRLDGMVEYDDPPGVKFVPAQGGGMKPATI